MFSFSKDYNEMILTWLALPPNRISFLVPFQQGRSRRSPDSQAGVVSIPAEVLMEFYLQLENLFKITVHNSLLLG